MLGVPATHLCSSTVSTYRLRSKIESASTPCFSAHPIRRRHWKQYYVEFELAGAIQSCASFRINELLQKEKPRWDRGKLWYFCGFRARHIVGLRWRVFSKLLRAYTGTRIPKRAIQAMNLSEKSCFIRNRLGQLFRVLAFVDRRWFRINKCSNNRFKHKVVRRRTSDPYQPSAIHGVGAKMGKTTFFLRSQSVRASPSAQHNGPQESLLWCSTKQLPPLH